MVAFDVNKVFSVVRRSKDAITKGHEIRAIVFANGAAPPLFPIWGTVCRRRHVDLVPQWVSEWCVLCVIQLALWLLTRSDLLLFLAAFTDAGERSIHPATPITSIDATSVIARQPPLS